MRTTLELPDLHFEAVVAHLCGAGPQRHAQRLRLETFGTQPAATGVAFDHQERKS